MLNVKSVQSRLRQVTNFTVFFTLGSALSFLGTLPAHGTVGATVKAEESPNQRRAIIKLAHTEFQQAICLKLSHLYSAKSHQKISDEFSLNVANIQRNVKFSSIKEKFDPELLLGRSIERFGYSFIYKNVNQEVPLLSTNSQAVITYYIQCHHWTDIATELNSITEKSDKSSCLMPQKIYTDQSFLEMFPTPPDGVKAPKVSCQKGSVPVENSAVPLCKPFCPPHRPVPSPKIFAIDNATFATIIHAKVRQEKNYTRDCRPCQEPYKEYDPILGKCINNDGCPFPTALPPEGTEIKPITARTPVTSDGLGCKFLCQYGFLPSGPYFCVAKSAEACNILDTYTQYLESVAMVNLTQLVASTYEISCQPTEIYAAWNAYRTKTLETLKHRRQQCYQSYQNNPVEFASYIGREFPEYDHVTPLKKGFIESFKTHLLKTTHCKIDVFSKNQVATKSLQDYLHFSFDRQDFIELLQKRRIQWHYEKK